MTANHQNQARFSLEELAVCLSMMGKPEAAKQMLITYLGEINADEERGRLLAVNHTLLAKEILYLEGENVRLRESFARLLSPLVYSDAVLRCSRKARGKQEQVLSHHFRNGSFVRHEIDYGVVHTLTEVTTKDEVITACTDFLEIEGDQPTFSVPAGRLTQEQLEEARAHAIDSVQSAAEYLQSKGIPQETSQLFAQDLNQTVYRGSVLRVETTPEGLKSDTGFLTLKGTSGRTWFLEIIVEEGTPFVEIAPARAKVIEKAILELFS